MVPQISEPGGNVILKSKKASFQVCSEVIADASPVFRAMFRHHWREGQAIQNAEPNSPVTIELPGDDPDMLRIFVRTAHDQILGIPRELDISYIHRLAVFVDKYDCAPLLRNYGEILIYRVLHNTSLKDDWWVLLQYAYVLKSEALFDDLSRRLAVRLPGKVPGQVTSWCFAAENIELFVPVEEIKEKLDALSKSYLATLSTILMAPQDIVIDCTCLPRECSVGDYLYQLGELAIYPLPHSIDFGGKRPLDVIERAARLRPAVGVFSTGRCFEFCMLAELLTQGGVAARLEQAVSTGLCLQCVTPGPCDKHPEA